MLSRGFAIKANSARHYHILHGCARLVSNLKWALNERMISRVILVLTGPSGSGKTTLCNYLVAKYGFTQPRTCTTRKPRSEEDQNSYIFLDRAEFESKIHNDEMIEYVEAFGNYYGSPIGSFNTNQNIVIPLTASGARIIKEKYPNSAKIIKLNISKETMVRRILNRSPIDPNQLNMRMNELNEPESQYDYSINSNEPIDSVCRTLDQILSTNLHLPHAQN